MPVTRVHAAMMVVWVALVAPTVIWWSDSILWVLFLSIYACFMGHCEAWTTARQNGRSSEGANGPRPRPVRKDPSGMFWIEKEELSKLLARHVCAGVPGTTGCIRPDGGCAVVDLGLALRHVWMELETEIGLGQRQAIAALELMRRVGELEGRLRERGDEG